MKTPELQSRPLPVMALSVRPAGPRDCDHIVTLMNALDLGYPAMDPSRFWVAETHGMLVAAAELKEGDGWALLSCVGVRQELQRQGIGRALVQGICAQTRSSVYLYTLVPEFFRKAGFADVTAAPAGLPSRSIYGCAGCSPLLCRCLVRTP